MEAPTSTTDLISQKLARAKVLKRLGTVTIWQRRRELPNHTKMRWAERYLVQIRLVGQDMWLTAHYMIILTRRITQPAKSRHWARLMRRLKILNTDTGQSLKAPKPEQEVRIFLRKRQRQEQKQMRPSR